MLPLTGYADRFSVAPGQTIAFKVSSTAATPYQARLVRLISGDPNPAGPGIKEEPVPAPFAPSYPSRVQPVPLGSYLRVPDAPAFGRLRSFTLVATIWPTLPDRGRQGIIARHDPARGTGFALFVDARGAGALVGNGRGGVRTVHVGKPFLARAWYRVWASYDAATRTLTVGQAPLAPRVRADDAGVAAAVLDGAPALDSGTPLLVAALGGAPVAGHYNGKIERPAVYDAALEPAKLAEPGGAPGRHLVALWDFAARPSSTRAVDVGPNGLHGELVNLPARAMMGSNWTGARDVLAPRAGRVRRHPLPRRRPVRLRLGDRLHLHGAGRAPERRLRRAARGGRRRGHDPVLRPAAAGPADGRRLRAHAHVHLHRLREHRPRRHERRVPRAGRAPGARARGRATSTRTTGSRRTTFTTTGAGSPTPRGSGRS